MQDPQDRAPSGAHTTAPGAALVDEAAAAEVLEVTAEAFEAMVDQGLLTPVDTADGRRFTEAEVQAVRLQGG